MKETFQLIFLAASLEMRTSFIFSKGLLKNSILCRKLVLFSGAFWEKNSYCKSFIYLKLLSNIKAFLRWMLKCSMESTRAFLKE